MSETTYYFIKDGKQILVNTNDEINFQIKEFEGNFDIDDIEVRTWEDSFDLEDGFYETHYDFEDFKEAVWFAIDEVDCGNIKHAEIWKSNEDKNTFDTNDFIFCAKNETDEELECY